MNKDFDQPPAILINASRRKKIRTALANQNAHHISNSHYAPDAVKAALELIYNEKCSYCESTVKQVAALQVEHYRAKNGISDDPGHNGYYWLALEWSNLILGCPACNGQGAKGNLFPVAGIRVFNQNPFDAAGKFLRNILLPNFAPLLGEQPFLLHPELDNPKEHLKISAFAILEGMTERGTQTIDICKLNRDPLILERQRIINDFLVQCNIVFVGKVEFDLKDHVVDSLLKAQLKLLKAHRDNPKEPYTFFTEFMLDNPETCIVVRIEPEFHADFRRAFEQFRLEELT